MSTQEIIEKTKVFLEGRINSLAINNPMIAFFKPMIVRLVNNNAYKATGFLSMMADENGEINMQSLVTEMINSIMTTRPFVVHTGFLGDVELGGGFIKLNIPMTDNQIAFGKQDLDLYKELFTTNDA